VAILFALALSVVRAGTDPIRPDAKLTPGAVMPNVTVEQVCQRGYANRLHGGVRNVPESLKRAVFIGYFGKIPDKPGNFEIDHLISLELGGSNEIKNLWPESYRTPTWNARVKDKLEDRMAAEVRRALAQSNLPTHDCAEIMRMFAPFDRVTIAQGNHCAALLLKQYQKEIARDWIGTYQSFVRARLLLP